MRPPGGEWGCLLDEGLSSYILKASRLTIVRVVFGKCVLAELYIENIFSIVGGDLFLFWILLKYIVR